MPLLEKGRAQRLSITEARAFVDYQTVPSNLSSTNQRFLIDLCPGALDKKNQEDIICGFILLNFCHALNKPPA